MKQNHASATLSRRGLLARLAAISASYLGLGAFSRFASSAAATPWDDNFELAVDFEIPQQRGGRSHRPYVAVWVEDSAGHPVRTLNLWVNKNDRGPRYFHELRRWWADDNGGRLAGGPDLISTVASATRLPGQYTVTWNGRDDRGRVVEQGTYRIFIEAAREHGSYGLMQQELQLATEPKAADLPGNDEIAKARIEYRRRK